MNRLDFDIGDTLHSDVSLVEGVETHRHYVVEDVSYTGASTDGYGDYVPPETTLKLRVLQTDGTYDEDLPSVYINTTWTTGEIRVRVMGADDFIMQENHLHKLARTMKRVFV